MLKTLFRLPNEAYLAKTERGLTHQSGVEMSPSSRLFETPFAFINPPPTLSSFISKPTLMNMPIDRELLLDLNRSSQSTLTYLHLSCYRLFTERPKYLSYVTDSLPDGCCSIGGDLLSSLCQQPSLKSETASARSHIPTRFLCPRSLHEPHSRTNVRRLSVRSFSSIDAIWINHSRFLDPSVF